MDEENEEFNSRLYTPIIDIIRKGLETDHMLQYTDCIIVASGRQCNTFLATTLKELFLKAKIFV